MKMNLNLRSKLILIFIILGLVPFAFIGKFGYDEAGDSIEESEQNHLTAIRELKKQQVEELFQEIGRDITILGKSGDVHRLFRKLTDYHKTSAASPDGDFDVLSPAYREVLKDDEVEVLKEYVSSYDYYDLFLICKDHGHVMFSIGNEDDKGTNLGAGKYKHTHLAKLWERIVEDPKVTVEDFQAYAPSAGIPALFIGAPIIRSDGVFIGVIALQIKVEMLNEAMVVNEGLGETGETYMVGKDYLLRSDSRLVKENTVSNSFESNIAVETTTTKKALKGESGLEHIVDYRGEKVISAYTHVDFYGIHWALLTEIDEDEIYSNLYELKNVLWLVGIIVAAVIVLIGFLVARSISRPINQATQDLNTSSTEILAAIQQQATSTKEQAVSIQETTTTMEEVNQTGAQITEKAQQVAQSAEATSTASVAGIGAVEEANATMESIREQVELVAENIVMLSEKTQVIGEIITTVNDIAEQSNLLALNAAIEAVGAGEQGQRFSVVANEIKHLAERAKESTVQVRTILSEIQKGINTSVMATEEAVKRVEAGKSKSEVAAETIRQLTDSTQQSIQAFQQIVGGTNQQQIGLEQVTEALKNIRVATEQTSSGIGQIEKAVAMLNELSSTLNRIVEKK